MPLSNAPVSAQAAITEDFERRMDSDTPKARSAALIAPGEVPRIGLALQSLLADSSPGVWCPAAWRALTRAHGPQVCLAPCKIIYLCRNTVLKAALNASSLVMPKPLMIS